MYKFAFAILLAAVAPPAAFGEQVKPRRATTAKVLRAPAASREAHKARVVARVSRARASKARPADRTSGGAAGRRGDRRGTPRVTFQSGESLPVVKGRDRAGQEHWDPNKSGNPLLNTGGAHRLKMLSENFSVAEVARSGDRPFTVARIDPRQIICLQKIRDHVGKPVRVSSGYRSFRHNVEVYRRLGKEPTRSQHISGRASDVWVEGMTGLEIAKAAVDACGPGVAVGLGLHYAHVDVRGASTTWKYGGVPQWQTAELERYRAARRLALKPRVRRQRKGQQSKRALEVAGRAPASRPATADGGRP